MTFKHGSQPSTKPNKKESVKDDIMERSRGIKPNMPPRDDTTRTEGVTEKHRKQDRNSLNKTS